MHGRKCDESPTCLILLRWPTLGKCFPQIVKLQSLSACQRLPSTARCGLLAAYCLLLPASRLLIPKSAAVKFVTSGHVRVRDHAIIAPLEVSAHE